MLGADSVARRRAERGSPPAGFYTGRRSRVTPSNGFWTFEIVELPRASTDVRTIAALGIAIYEQARDHRIPIVLPPESPVTSIIALDISDVRFPTSDFLDGSDAMNPDPDYSAAYAVVRTSEDGLSGFGLTFTIGRGNDLVCAAIQSLSRLVIGLDLDDIEARPAAFWRRMVGDSQLRWLGPEKGVVHLAAAAVVNAVWDALARRAGKPLWKYVADMTSEQIVGMIDFRHIRDALTEEEALEILRASEPGRAEREAKLIAEGYPAYTTSAGWLGYDDDKIRALCRGYLDQGWSAFKIKVGQDLEDDKRRCRVIRETIGPDRELMIDANQVWDVPVAIAWVNALREFRPRWIEEPTSPDDVLGHKAVRDGVHPIGVATGEHCHNRVMFKQFLQAGSIDYVQLDGCRLGGLNEVMAVMLMAAKFGVPICPHSGGVGLCEYVQHFSMIDYLRVSKSMEGRWIEHSAHLHEPFVDPIRIREGRYLAPQMPGFSVEMHPDSVARHRFPDGLVWRERAG